MARRITLLLLVFAAGASTLAAIGLAAAGDLDRSWGSGGVATLAIGTNGDSTANASTMQGDKLVVAGRAVDTDRVKIALARFNGDGSLDTSFGTSGTTLVEAGDGGSAEALDIAVDGSGRIVVAGHAADGGEQKVAVARFDAQGRPDASFGAGGVALHTAGTEGESAAQSLVTDGGKLVVAGYARDGGQRKVLVGRFDSQGGVDESFGGGIVLTSAGSGGDAEASGIARDSSGRFVVAGTALDPGERVLVARYAPSGSLDTSFGSGGLTLGAAESGASDVALQGDKPVIVGHVVSPPETRLLVSRYGTDGRPDESFTDIGMTSPAAGSGGNAVGESLTLAPDGSIVIAGSAADDGGGELSNQFVVARFGRDGRLDAGFGDGGTALTALEGGGTARAVSLQSDGKPLVSGGALGETANSMAVARFLSSDSQSGGGGDGGGDGGGGTGERCADGDTPTTENISQLIQIRACVDREGPRAWLLRGREVRLNGLILKSVDPRARIVLDKPAGRLYSEHPLGGNAKVKVSLPGIKLFTKKLDLPLDGTPIAEDETKPGQTILGLKVEGKVSLTFIRAGVDRGFPQGVLVDLQVRLPEIFKGTQGAVRVRADNKNGLFLDGLEVQAKQALIGPLKVEDFLLRFSLAADLWEGKARIYLGDAPLDVAVAMGFRPFRLDSFMASIEDLNKQVATGVFLQDVFVSLTTDPLELTGKVRLTAGPKIAAAKAVEIVGQFVFTMPKLVSPSTPKWTFRIDGSLSVAGLEAGSGYVGANSRPFVEAGVKFKQNFVIGRIDVDINGWIDRLRAFNFEGSGLLCVGACVSADAVVSSKGAAACVGFSYTDEEQPDRSFSFGLGLGVTWDPVVPMLWFPVCSVGTYSEARPAGLAAASSFSALTRGRSSQARQAVRFEPGLPLGVVKAVGQSAPPNVILTGPNGERVETAGTPLGYTQREDHVILRSPGDRSLYVALVRPAAGAWTVEQAPGSDPVVEIGSGNGRPPVSVDASVAATAAASAAGRAKSLRYSIKERPGQVVRFVEEANGVARAIGRAKGARGALRFTPADGPAGRRRIVAHVEQAGLPRESVEVARYTAPPPLRPSAPRRLRAVRRGSRLKLTWRPVQGAEEYLVRVNIGDGRRILAFAPRRRRSVVVRGFERNDSARVSVRARTESLREGRAAKARVKKKAKRSTRRTRR